MKHPTLQNACSRYGASMGRLPSPRAGLIERMTDIRLRLYKMPMSPCGCYDKGGAYWGRGDAKVGWMYHAHGENAEGCEYSLFVRAVDRKQAKEKVRQSLPNVKFFR